jgi:hypothetical protein
MVKFLAHKFQLPNAVSGTLAAAAFALMAFTGAADAASLQTHMQELADNAALTGVNTLGTSEARAEADKRDAAIKASKRMIADIPGITADVTASVENLTVTVKLASKALQVASTARYIPADQPANWAWASRQHFAIGRDPVVVGSTCSQDCGSSRLR